jgi:hypothetical protein
MTPVERGEFIVWEQTKKLSLAPVSYFSKFTGACSFSRYEK